MEQTALLEKLARTTAEDAATTIAALGVERADAIAALAEAALEHAETDPPRAAHWLTIAESLRPDPHAATPRDAALAARIAYARARLHLLAGEMPAAERSLLRAQALWSTVGDQVSLTRSGLGLTQILTMQGRYGEAETIIARTVEQLAHLAETDAAFVPRLIVAHRNHANLLRYQEKHAPALAEYQRALRLLTEHRAHRALSADEIQPLAREEAHLNLNMATVLMALDRPAAAETALDAAITMFDRAQDALNRGRAHSNRGSLYLRTGRYAAALAEFDRANADLLGDVVLHPDLPAERLRQADVTLLDQAMVYVTLNLLPEARNALALCQRIFQEAEHPNSVPHERALSAHARPYELGQTFYTLGLVHLRSGNHERAQAVLEQAEQLFLDLNNRYWLNRTRLALAAHCYQQGDSGRTQAYLHQLSTWDRAADSDRTLAWDVSARLELCSLRVRLFLDADQIDRAHHEATAMDQILGDVGGEPLWPGDPTAEPLPHLRMRLSQARGRIELAAGRRSVAHEYLQRALHLLESQRVSLPLEEVRSAFLHDKGSIYSDLILSLLDEVEKKSGAAGGANNEDAKTRTDTGVADTGVAEAFALVERARARALLDRLFASVPDADVPQTDAALLDRRNGVRQRLHWLYNQLLDGAASPQAVRTWQHEIWTHEATLQKLEWQSTALLRQAQPVTLSALQGALPAAQQAVVYFVAGDEVLAFVVGPKDGPEDVHIVRRLCTVAQLDKAQRELRFQLGRAELGREYLARNASRLHAALKAVLHELYTLLYAPLARHVHAARLLFIPHGALHLVPLHLLWTGTGYLLQQAECSYAPSASMAVYCRSRAGARVHQPYRSLAGFALTDASIPHAAAEVAGAAAHFERAWSYVDEAASHASLREAAARADILHMATHGLFRADNPFFSALKLTDGWIDVREIYRLNLRARLVVLSACKSGSGRIQGGDEVVGLARGFLGAGAHTLLVSAWNVHDASAAALMERFYTHLTVPNTTPATALRQAQQEAAARGEHPYFWGSFFVIGA